MRRDYLGKFVPFQGCDGKGLELPVHISSPNGRWVEITDEASPIYKLHEGLTGLCRFWLKKQ